MSTDAIAPVISLTQSDLDSVAPRQRRSRNANSGRRRFANTCVHREQYKADTGEDFAEGQCPKFAHLPGDGRGPAGTNIFRAVRVLAVGFIKPLFYLGLLVVAYFLLTGFLGSLPFGNFIPGPEFGVPANNGPSSNGAIPAPGTDGNSVPAVGNPGADDSVVTP